MSERIGEVRGVVVTVFATPQGPRVNIITSDPLNGSTLTGAEAAALAGTIMRAADKANAAPRGPKGTP